MRTPSGDTDGVEDDRSKSNDLGDQDEAPTTVRVPVRLDLFSTGLELIEVPIVAGGAMTVAPVELRPSARASAPACVPVEVWERQFLTHPSTSAGELREKNHQR